jgi:hypothetical protein
LKASSISSVGSSAWNYIGIGVSCPAEASALVPLELPTWSTTGVAETYQAPRAPAHVVLPVPNWLQVQLVWSNGQLLSSLS